MQNHETQVPDAGIPSANIPSPISMSLQPDVPGTSTGTPAAAPTVLQPAPRSRYSQILESPELSSLTAIQKEFLKERWQEQITWFSRRAKQNQQWYTRIRLLTIVGSVVVPALLTWGSVPLTAFLVSSPTEPAANSAASISPAPELTNPFGASPINPAMQHQLQLYRAALITGVGLSQLVAICAAVEQFFKFGDRWRHYRRSAELLKTHGWQFFELTGPYAPYNKHGGHAEAFHLFASQIEEVIQSDVDGYVSQITIPKPLLREER